MYALIITHLKIFFDQIQWETEYGWVNNDIQNTSEITIRKYDKN
jgi:hypothetical protein